MYPRISWELVVYPLGSAEHTLGTTGPVGSSLNEVCTPTFLVFHYQFVRSKETQRSQMVLYEQQTGKKLASYMSSVVKVFT
jgi:hypothetical protein